MSKGKAKRSGTRRPRVMVMGSGQPIEGVRRAGGVPVSVGCTSSDLLDQFVKADAVVLTGGGDVDPRRYGEKRHRETYGVWELRDDAEITIAELALETGTPILGICRGAQILNVAAGGTLHQHIPDLDRGLAAHWTGRHAVRTAKGSAARILMGEHPSVVSIHHQAVAKVGKDLKATAWAHDGLVIEAIESRNKEAFVMGVQFHPELALGDHHMQSVFNGLVDVAARVAHKPLPTRVVPAKRLPSWKPKSATATQAAGYTASEGWYTDNLPTTSHRPELPRLKPLRSITEWVCYRCTIEFDDRDDWEDHMYFLHESMVEGADLGRDEVVGSWVKRDGVWVREEIDSSLIVGEAQ